MKINYLALVESVRPGHLASAIATFISVALFVGAGSAAAPSTPVPFSTFLAPTVSIQGIGHDAAGNIYALGVTSDSAVPGHTSDIVAARLDPNAAALTYFVYPGSGADTPRALAVDAQGNAYITGYTSSSDFPVTSGFSGPVPSGTAAPFIMKLNPNGEIVYATLFAGAVSAFPQAIAVDTAGDAIVTGYAGPDYAATPGSISVSDSDQTTNTSPFVTKLDPTGVKILFSAVGVGGSYIALGSQGDIFVAGNTSSAAYPTTTGAFQTAFTPTSSCTTGPGIGFCFPARAQYVTRLNGNGTTLVYSTFLAGPSGATNSGLAVDSAGNAYVTGTASSKDYPFTGTSASDRPGLFLSKLDPTGSKLLWSVQQGGNLLTLDANANPVVGGSFVPVTAPPDTPSGVTFPPPPPTGNMPAGCLPNGTTVQSIAYVQNFSAPVGATIATQLLSASQAIAGGMTIEPDGRIVLGGYTYFPDVPLSTGVLFNQAAAQRTVPGAFLAAFNLSQSDSASQLGCVVDSATLFPIGPVAPGQLVTLYGSGIGPQTGVSGFAAGQTALPTSLGNVQVIFDGTPAPLLYASAGQVNVQVPFLAQQKASTVMSVSVDSTTVASRMFAVTASNPSVFLDASATPGTCDLRLANTLAFAAVALNPDGSANACSNPAAAGSTVTVFLNGVAAMLGGASPASGSITGPNPNAFGSQLDVRAGTLSLAAGPLYPAPGMIAGVDQLAVQLPAVFSPGQQEVNLQIAIDGIQTAPFEAYSGTLYQQPVIVWVHP